MCGFWGRRGGCTVETLGKSTKRKQTLLLQCYMMTDEKHTSVQLNHALNLRNSPRSSDGIFNWVTNLYKIYVDVLHCTVPHTYLCAIRSLSTHHSIPSEISQGTDSHMIIVILIHMYFPKRLYTHKVTGATSFWLCLHECVGMCVCKRRYRFYTYEER